MVRIPPEWDHGAITLDGQTHGEEDSIVCVHWMTRCLQWNLCSKASIYMLDRKTSDIADSQRNDVSEVAMSHYHKAKRKAGNTFVFFQICRE